MNQILIGKGSTLAYAAKIGGGLIASYAEVNQLQSGALAVFTPAGVLLTAANVVAQMADQKGVYLAVGTGDANKGADVTIITERLKVSYSKKAYVAPVKLKKVIGQGATNAGSLNLPGTLVAGTDAFVRITDVTAGLIQTGMEIKRYDHVVSVGDTPTLIVQDLVNQINGDRDSIVVATIQGAGLGINLVSKNFGTVFKISLDGILVNATIDEPENPLASTDSITINYGEGTPTEVGNMERLFSTQLGNTNQVYQPQLWWTKTAKTDPAATYDVYNILWMGHKNMTTGGALNTVAHQIVVAIPNGATQETAFEAVMAEVYGNAETEETGV